MAWLTGWTYRKKITITGASGAGTNFQVLLKVGESSGASGADFHLENKSSNFPSAKNNGGDLRFTDSDETTLLDFWVEQVTGSSPNRVAYIWVEVADDLGSNQDIYCYFGNSSASSASNGANTFLFFDDFDGSYVDGSKWNKFDGTSASSVATNGDSTVTYSLMTNSYTISNGVIEALQYETNEYVDSQMWYRSQAANDDNSYLWVRRDRGDYSLHDSYFHKRVADNWGSSYNVASYSPTTSAWRIARVILNGSNFYVYVLNTSYSQEHSNSWSESTWSSGYIGFRHQFESSSYSKTDWIRVRKYNATSPVFNSAGSLETLTESTTALQSTLEAQKKDTVATLSDLQAEKKSPVAIQSTFEQEIKSTASLQSTLEKALKATASLYSLLEKYQVNTTALSSLLEKQGKSPVAFTSLLEKSQSVTTAIQTLLETLKKSNVALTSQLERQLKSTTALWTELETTLLGADTVALYSLLEKLTYATVSLQTTLEKCKGETVALSTFLQYERTSSAALQSTLEKALQITASFQSTLEKVLTATVSFQSTLEKAIENTVAMSSELEAKQFSATALLSVLEKRQQSVVALLTQLEYIRTTTTALNSTLEATKLNTVALYADLNYLRTVSVALKSWLEGVSKGTIALRTLFEKTTQSTIPLLSVLRPYKVIHPLHNFDKHSGLLDNFDRHTSKIHNIKKL